MLTPSEVTVTCADARLMLSLWMLQPVWSTVMPRACGIIAASGITPGAGQAIHGLPARPVPVSVHMHDARSVPPIPIGPSEFESTQRRWPMVVGLPGSIIYKSTDDTAWPLDTFELPAAFAPSAL